MQKKFKEGRTFSHPAGGELGCFWNRLVRTVNKNGLKTAVIDDFKGGRKMNFFTPFLTFCPFVFSLFLLQIVFEINDLKEKKLL